MGKKVGHWTDEEMIENVGEGQVGLGIWIVGILTVIPWLVGVGVLVCQVFGLDKF
jgi:hypothetical protein